MDEPNRVSVVVLFYRDGSGTNCEVTREVGLAISEAFEQVDKVESPLWPYNFSY